MVAFGYALSSEEHHPTDLVRHARAAEDAGFAFALISDHFHPWVDAQGHCPFVWSVIGGIATATERLTLGTGVTCPTVRVHPAIVAQAAATSAAMMPGRFFLGVGTGENLNEHVLGDRWPEYAVRAEMLEEAVAVIRRLWAGDQVSHRGRHYTVENARLYTLPEEPIPLHVAAGGAKAAALAGRIGDGLIATGPDPEVMTGFDQSGGAGKPRFGKVDVCWAKDEAAARKTVHELWAFSALPGELSQELPTPAHFQQATQLVTEEKATESVVCGPDPEAHLAAIREYVDAGFDHVYVQQIGPEQDGFMDFYAREVLPRL
ncbi:MAG: Similar to F420-dependent glucose-6-phosphate dehydrogenase, SCO6495 family [uncultured Thermomicrobiales bacterium]|uniref:Similar to F420-dependent glucose-6-phosphate dehydrogenase, SCO6495 family n=1 Tax=uncultured Thermomicrobiales bacterium TaxID=1645740 RepID=A0A6J4TMD9_9BACT|nr:MAG: Similar to F420-dependent glucose-6-phosphate dehydrogenase, SCO6495 family [uncultured Thermomicrobiales bacterium]